LPRSVPVPKRTRNGRVGVQAGTSLPLPCPPPPSPCPGLVLGVTRLALPIGALPPPRADQPGRRPRGEVCLASNAPLATLDQARIAILGLGYVGLPLAAAFGKRFPT